VVVAAVAGVAVATVAIDDKPSRRICS